MYRHPFVSGVWSPDQAISFPPDGSFWLLVKFASQMCISVAILRLSGWFYAGVSVLMVATHPFVARCHETLAGEYAGIRLTKSAR